MEREGAALFQYTDPKENCIGVDHFQDALQALTVNDVYSAQLEITSLF